MALGTQLERNLDKVGGIIAAASFAVCLLMHLWRLLQHRCYPLATSSIFLLLRIIGWILAAIGAIKDDASLNKRGAVVNALVFWLLMYSGYLFIARWEVSRRGINWDTRSTVISGIAFVACVVFGALEASGQISWLNSPKEDPKVTLKVSEIGFLVLAILYALVAGYFNVHESVVYHGPGVRLSFYLTSALFLARCIFTMIVALRIVTFAQDKRELFLFCLTVPFEVLVCALWGFSSIARDLQPRDNTPIGELPPLDNNDNSNSGNDHGSAQPALTKTDDMHKFNTYLTHDSMFDSQRHEGSHLSATQVGNSGAYDYSQKDSYSAAGASAATGTSHAFNPWSNSYNDEGYGLHSYAQPRQDAVPLQPPQTQAHSYSSYSNQDGHASLSQQPYPPANSGGVNTHYRGHSQSNSQAPPQSAYSYDGQQPQLRRAYS